MGVIFRGRMIRSLGISFLAFLLFYSKGDAENSSGAGISLIMEADRLYSSMRHKKEKAQEVLKLLSEAEVSSPDDYEVLWRVSRALFWLSEIECDAGNSKRCAELGKKGYEKGLMAIERAPERVEGHFYAGLSIGYYGLGIGVVRALTKGIEKKYLKALHRSIEIDPQYEYAGAYRALGRFYYSLPWPRYDGEKSIQYLDQSLAIAPNKIRSHVYLAETHLKEKKTEDARKHLAIALSLDPGKEDYPDGVIFQEKARRLMQVIENKR